MEENATTWTGLDDLEAELEAEMAEPPSANLQRVASLLGHDPNELRVWLFCCFVYGKN